MPDRNKEQQHRDLKPIENFSASSGSSLDDVVFGETMKLWEPDRKTIESSQMFAFLERVNQELGLALKDFHELYDWSVAEPQAFWQQFWNFADIKCSRPASRILENPEQMPGAQWFADAQLNFAENLLRYRDAQEALVFWNEQGRQRVLTYAELFQTVAQTAAALKELGVVPGDRIAGFIPNIPEACIYMLAVTSIGAIWSSSSPDFETQGVLDRFGQIEPKVLIVADGYLFKGKQFNSLPRVAELEKQLPGLERIIVVPYLSDNPDLSSLRKALRQPDFLQPFSEVTEIEFAQLPANHPVYIMYSSGTTGAPKCMVHGAVGTLLEHFKEHLLHTDVSRSDRLFYATTCGWMMWNWLVSGLGTGATLLLYDGFPFARDGKILFDMAQGEKVSIFGTSAGFLSAAEKFGLKPGSSHKLESLKAILSTGSPLLEENFDYVYSEIKPAVRLCSISGGTDIIGCFALGNPMLPIERGWLQSKSLGLAVDVVDDMQQTLVGQTGELVCKAPFPSMPTGFWNDPTGEKYLNAYFSHFRGIWWHGDYAIQSPGGAMKILGRSDATLNPGGVRIGTAEIYRAVERVPEIQDSLVVGQKFDGDERVILFVILKQGEVLSKDLEQKIRSEMPSPRHRPARILQVSAIPVTRSGKKSELAIKKLIHGEEPKNVAALANPEALDQYRNRPELAS